MSVFTFCNAMKSSSKTLLSVVHVVLMMLCLLHATLPLCFNAINVVMQSSVESLLLNVVALQGKILCLNSLYIRPGAKLSVILCRVNEVKTLIKLASHTDLTQSLSASDSDVTATRAVAHDVV